MSYTHSLKAVRLGSNPFINSGQFCTTVVLDGVSSQHEKPSNVFGHRGAFSVKTEKYID